MKLNNKDIAIISLIAALMIVIGYFIYLLSVFFPLPGSKFIIMSGFLSFMITIAIVKVEKNGVVTLISIVFGVIMGFISIVMGLAIILTGILTELTALILFNNYQRKRNIVFTSSFYPFYSFILGLLATNYITGNHLFKIGGVIPFIISGLIVFGLGILGSLAAYKIVFSRLELKNNNLSKF